MCDCCRRLKAALWTARAQSEVQTGLRNWFGTLTLSPGEHHQIVSRCRLRLARGGTDFDALSKEEQFSERMTELGSEVTRWMKRVRKESGAPLRYLLVAEAHKSGLPHLHILIHELSPGAPVRYRTLSTQWKLGFVKFNLVEGMKAARYVCKYISKSAMARVRASLHYGTYTNVREERSEAGAVEERRPRERAKISVSTYASEVSSLRNSLTDHSGGKQIGIVNESRGDRATEAVEQSTNAREHTEHDAVTEDHGKRSEGILQKVERATARASSPAGDEGFFEGQAVPTVTGTEGTVAGADDCKESGTGVASSRERDRTQDHQEIDPDCPF